MFGYVIQGEIVLVMNDKRYHAKKGESFYVSEPGNHHIEAITKTNFIWVSTPPIF
jgi:quercetin dioxygenase-like cupin family protein